MPPSTQDILFQRIREKLPPNGSLSEAVADALSLSNDSAYRRIRGETPLVIEEVSTLCSKFNISADYLFHLETASVLFTPVQLDNEHYSFETYLAGILKNLQSLSAIGDAEVFYIAKDLPIFHHFAYRPLFAFRYFFWMKSILQHPQFVNQKFSMDCLPSKVEGLGRGIMETYGELPSTEIWNTECVNSTIGQVEYYREAGYFEDAADINRIYEAVHQTLDHVRAQAEAGSKFLPGESAVKSGAAFNLFYNRVILGDNTILVLVNGRKVLYLNYDVLNYMVTEDPQFCENVYQKMQTLMRRATIISTVSEKQRNIFFNILLKKIPR